MFPQEDFIGGQTLLLVALIVQVVVLGITQTGALRVPLLTSLLFHLTLKGFANNVILKKLLLNVLHHPHLGTQLMDEFHWVFSLLLHHVLHAVLQYVLLLLRLDHESESVEFMVEGCALEHAFLYVASHERLQLRVFVYRLYPELVVEPEGVKLVATG